MVEGLRLGVDFGTSATKIALKLPRKAPVALPIGEDQTTPYMPSVVTYPVSQPLAPLVGEEALRSAALGTSVRSIKRCLGCSEGPCDARRCAALPWCDGSGSIRLGPGDAVSPEAAVRAIILEAIRRAREAAWRLFRVRLDDLEGVGMGCGACFDHDQRAALVAIVHEAFGAHVPITVIDEPIATAVAYGNLSGIGPGRVLICDYGGGTFDAALLDIEDARPARFTLLAADGVQWLGGDDIDLMVYERFLSALAQGLQVPVTELSDAMASSDRQMLRSQSLQAKESLSSQDRFETTVFSENLGIMPLDLARDDLEGMLRKERRFESCTFVDRSLHCVRRTITVAEVFRRARHTGLLANDTIASIRLDAMGSCVEGVVMVGGVTRMPLVRKALKESFGADKLISQQVLDPICAVAIGAAYAPPADHYSILHPPYSIRLEFRHKDGRCLEDTVLHAAGDKLDYLGRWPSNSLPVFTTPRKIVSRTYSIGYLVFEVGGVKIAEHRLRALDKTEHYATIDLAGRVCVDGAVTRRHDAIVPLLHRWQRDIASAERARAEDEEEARLRAVRGRDHTLYTEN